MKSVLTMLCLMAACGGKPAMPPLTSGGSDTGEAPELVAPGLVGIGGGHYFLGEWDALVIVNFDGDGDDSQTVIPESSFTIEGFWIDRYPFPGHPGDDWFADGMNLPSVSTLDAWLQDYGRRACTMSELLLAGAGTDNLRYPYGDGSHDPSACDADDANPQPIGSFPGCISTTGVRDFQVRSTWGRLDREMVEVMAQTDQAEDFPSGLDFAVWGGTSRTDTFYAPNNFGFHLHGEDDTAYLDDGFRVCAGPSAPSKAQDAAYAMWLDDVRAAGSFAGIFE